MQNNSYTALLSMDLRKAFDTVSHHILLHKLYHYGVRGPAHSLIESYLTSRKQFVSINNKQSCTKSINIGVPQGSILGPLLFLIYINDLSNAASSCPRLFADDTCLVVSNPCLIELEKNCNTEMQNLHWCSANALEINPNKSAIVTLPPKLRSPFPVLNIYYNNALIKMCASSKYLGINLDTKLDFKSHIANIEIKISRSIGILNKLRSLFPSSTLLLLYFTLIHPHLLYGLPLWGCTFGSYLKKLQSLQYKAIRIISNTSRRSSITKQYHNLGILKIIDLYAYEVAKLIHQHTMQKLPYCFTSFFTNISDIHAKNTRSNSKNNFYLPKYSTTRCQKSIRFQGPEIWNSLSPEIRNQPYSKFKNNLKKHLLEKYI